MVKLNNPLMGTETNAPPMFKMFKTSDKVKLNNPLMGTETNSNFMRSFINQLPFMLN